MPHTEPSPPKTLNALQNWFGSIIGEPLSVHGGIRKFAPNKKPIAQEAAKHIRQSPTLKPHQRLEIYNQQYWWRLINILQEFFPFTLRLFGYGEFSEKIAVPFLIEHRPVDWSLSTIGNLLPSWILKRYKGLDKQLVHDAALLDLSFHQIFFYGNYPAAPEEAIDQRLVLQTHVSLFELPYDLFSFRREMMTQTPEHWIDNPFPDLKKGTHHFRLFRNRQSLVLWKEISACEYLLLKQFENGATLDDGCEWLENQPESLRLEAEQNLETWFRDWTIQGLFSLSSAKT